MARASSSFENQMLQGVLGTAPTTNIIPYISLHSGDPGTTGASEISGGSPAYARQAETFGSPSSGSISNSASLTFNVPASTTIGWVGHWTASSSGTYGVGAALNSSVTFGSQSTLTFAVAADSISVS